MKGDPRQGGLTSMSATSCGQKMRVPPGWERFDPWKIQKVVSIQTFDGLNVQEEDISKLNRKGSPKIWSGEARWTKAVTVSRQNGYVTGTYPSTSTWTFP
jgi:hypothetical protein